MGCISILLRCFMLLYCFVVFCDESLVVIFDGCGVFNGSRWEDFFVVMFIYDWDYVNRLCL